MKVFVLGNGPSLSHQQLAPGQANHERLQRELTVGTNWISLLGLDVDYLVWTDAIESDLWLSECRREGATTRRYCAGRPRYPDEVNPDALATLELAIRTYDIVAGPGLNEYLEDGLVRHGTVLGSAVNLAAILGANMVFLLGADFANRDGRLHFYDEREVFQHDRLHYHDEDHPVSQSFVESRVERDRNAQQQMERLAEWLVVNGWPPVWNCTEGGVLGGFPRCTLEEAFEMEDPVGDDVLRELDDDPELDSLTRIKRRAKQRLREEAVEVWRGRQGGVL